MEKQWVSGKINGCQFILHAKSNPLLVYWIQRQKLRNSYTLKLDYGRGGISFTNFFCKEEAETICSLPLSLFGIENKLCWWPAKNGIFSIKSTYHLALSKEKEMGGEPSEKSKEDPNWQAIWRLKIPRSVKYFIWRAHHNILPTRMNLAKGRSLPPPHAPYVSLKMNP